MAFTASLYSIDGIRIEDNKNGLAQRLAQHKEKRGHHCRDDVLAVNDDLRDFLLRRHADKNGGQDHRC